MTALTRDEVERIRDEWGENDCDAPVRDLADTALALWDTYDALLSTYNDATAALRTAEAERDSLEGEQRAWMKVQEQTTLRLHLAEARVKELEQDFALTSDKADEYYAALRTAEARIERLESGLRLAVDDLHWWHSRNGAPSHRPDCDAGACRDVTALIGPALYSEADRALLSGPQDGEGGRCSPPCVLAKGHDDECSTGGGW